MLPHKEFYFIRHGQTDLNKKQLIMGSIDDPLNQEGIDQAHAAAKLLVEKNFTVIISSPRTRALETARIIGKKTGKQILIEENIVERNWGEAEGKPYNFSKTLFDTEHTPKGAEPFLGFQERIIKAFYSILLAHEFPLIVSHGGVFRALTDALGYKDIKSSNAIPYLFKPPHIASSKWILSSLYKEE